MLTVPLKQLWHSYSYAADLQEQKEPGPQAQAVQGLQQR